MKNLMLAIIAILLISSGCTLKHPASLDLSGCDYGDVDCIGNKYDEQRFSKEFQESCIPWKAMEGYEPPSFKELKEKGILDVDSMVIVPILSTVVGMPIIGFNMVYFSPTGDITHSQIRYTLGSPNSLIGHEISHLYCRDKGLTGWLAAPGYTPGQRAIMEKENVDKWTDTEYYKTEDDGYHYIYKGEK